MKLARVVLAAALGAVACRSVPEARFGVASIQIEGTHKLESSDLKQRIATQTAPKLLGLIRLRSFVQQPFEPAVLQRDLERIDHYYRRRGYYGAAVRAGRVRLHGEHWVDVRIGVEEGDPVRVRSVRIVGLEGATAATALRVRSELALAKGTTFDEEAFEAAASRARTLLADGGYAYAQVQPHAVVDLGTKAADLSYTVTLGPVCRIGAVQLDGLGGLPYAQIRRVFSVEPGDPYSIDDLEAARRALLDLGVFSSVEVDADLSTPNAEDVPVRVSVTRSALHGLRVGGGLLIDFTRADVHGLVAWEHRNLFGGLRHFTVEERPSIVFFPTALPNLSFPQQFLPANSVSATFNQPSFPEARAFTRVRAEFNRYPVILPPLDPNQQVMPGYNELRGLFGPERNFNMLHLRAAASYNIQANFPFTYFGPRNPAFQRVIASYLELRGEFDVRDDPISPSRGFWLATSLQFAGGVLGGDAADVRFRPEMRMYFPIADDVTIAVRGVLGLLFPRSYGDMLGADFLTLSSENLPGTQSGVPGYIRDLQITYFRGFFSGGADSNRGYGYRQIGPHGVNPAIIPGSVEEERARCTQGSANYAGSLCFVPSGGLSLWEASLELRAPLYGNLGMVVFVDASDVSPRVLQVRLEVPHLSAGFGIRYKTPVGPLRVDLGFRLPGLQRVGGELNPLTDGPTPSPLFGFLPAALAIGLGEAY